MQKLTFLIALAMCLFGCTPKPATRATAQASTEDRQRPDKATSSPNKQVPQSQLEKDDNTDSNSEKEANNQALTGLFRIVDGQQILVPCDDTAALYRLRPASADLADLYKSATMQGYPGQSVIAEIMVETPASITGELSPLGRAYTGEYAVASVTRVRAKNPRNACIPYEFWAVGNEPFWSLQISPAEGVVEFNQLGINTIRYNYTSPTREQDGKVWRYYFTGVQRLKITITQEPCTDSMAGNPYSFSALMEFGSRQYVGCATTAMRQ